MYDGYMYLLNGVTVLDIILLEGASRILLKMFVML